MRSLILAVFAFVLPDAPLWAAADVDYARDVKPILRARCGACHGALKQKAKLRLDTAASAVRGGESGPAFVAGASADSLLFRRVTSTDADSRMPPEGAALTE